MIDYKIKIWKTLSRNDTGETNSHQSGISIPKDIARSGIFPILTNETLNPRVNVDFFDEDDQKWSFQYIYYDDVYFRDDKRRGHNEYRITCVKDYINANNIKANDRIWFGLDVNGVRRIGFEQSLENNHVDYDEVILTLKGGWKVVKY